VPNCDDKLKPNNESYVALKTHLEQVAEVV